MIRIFEQDFEAMLRQYENSINNKRQFTALVKDIFPEEAKNINLILMAYNMGIAQDIQKANLLNNTFAFRYVKQLMDDYGISRVNADWIVSVWCSCYGNKVLGKACDISVQKQGGGPAIKDNKSSSGKSYGDLFVYEKSRRGNGLAVTGFRGDKNQTIIFQNRSGNDFCFTHGIQLQPVHCLCDFSHIQINLHMIFPKMTYYLLSPDHHPASALICHRLFPILYYHNKNTILTRSNLHSLC